MLARGAVLPGGRRPASAIRRFPPGCGRRHNAAAGPPPFHRLGTAAAAAAAATKTKPTLPNPSSAPAATNTAPPPPGRTLPAAASVGAGLPNRGVGNGRKAAAVETVRRVSAFRRYPPGCGRGVAVSKPLATEGEDRADKPSAVVGSGDAKARACDGEVMLRASAIDYAEFNANGGMKNGGDCDADAQEEGGGKPWVVTGLMAVPLLPWAQQGRRSQRLEA